MTRIFTLPALIWTFGFIALDLVGIGIVGDALAHRIGFDPSFLIPVSVLIIIAAGYAATRRGMWGATAGSLVTGAEMTAYIVAGNVPSGLVPRDQLARAGVIFVFVASLAGAVLGALGGWIAGRRVRVASAASA